MKRIDTWLDIQRYLSEASRMPFIPRETGRIRPGRFRSAEGNARTHVSDLCCLIIKLKEVTH